MLVAVMMECQGESGFMAGALVHPSVNQDKGLVDVQSGMGHGLTRKSRIFTGRLSRNQRFHTGTRSGPDSWERTLPACKRRSNGHHMHARGVRSQEDSGKISFQTAKNLAVSSTEQPTRNPKIHRRESREVRTLPGTVPRSGTRGFP